MGFTSFCTTLQKPAIRLLPNAGHGRKGTVGTPPRLQHHPSADDPGKSSRAAESDDLSLIPGSRCHALRPCNRCTPKGDYLILKSAPLSLSGDQQHEPRRAQMRSYGPSASRNSWAGRGGRETTTCPVVPCDCRTASQNACKSLLYCLNNLARTWCISSTMGSTIMA
jgi:hypothetical protein